MSSLAASPPVRSAAPASPIARLLTSSIGLKAVMALTGIVLSGFVLVHMAGNLNVFVGATAMDAYAASLHKVKAVLWGARLVLLVAVGLHVWAYLTLTRRSLGARPVGYRKVTPRESDYASRTMRYTGPLLAAFIVYHLLHFTVGSVHPNFQEGQVYQNVVTGLRVVPVAVFYLIALAALAFHVFHGVWSLFQTLGWSQPRYGSAARRVAAVFTAVVAGGFALVPLAVLAGILK